MATFRDAVTTMRHLSVFLKLSFAIGLVLVLLIWNSSRPSILVIHSYDPGYAWTRDINIGLQRVFRQQTIARVYYHYMNVKTASKEERKTAANYALMRFLSVKPDLTLIIDDPAQELVGSYIAKQGLSSVVFAGVNGGVEKYGYHQSDNVTGIFEHKPFLEIRDAIDLIRRSNPQLLHADKSMRSRIAYLTDGTDSAKNDVEKAQKFNWKPFELVAVNIVTNFPDWQAAVAGFNQEADFILVSSYRNLNKHRGKSSKNEKADPAFVMSWTEKNSKVPIIGMNIFNSEDGAGFAVGVSPYHQGEEAAKMALKIAVNKVPPSAIPQINDGLFIVSLRPQVFKEKKLNIPSVFNSFAAAVEKVF